MTEHPRPGTLASLTCTVIATATRPQYARVRVLRAHALEDRREPMLGWVVRARPAQAPPAALHPTVTLHALTAAHRPGGVVMYPA